MVVRLSNVLRRLLRKHENFTPLRDELSFIDDYLSIEVVRFGDKLRFEKDVAPDTLDMLVPSMLLQPLVENSIKHGLSNKVEGGSIRIAAIAAVKASVGGGRRWRWDPGIEAQHAPGSRNRRHQCQRTSKGAVWKRISYVGGKPTRPRHAHPDRNAGT